MCPHKSCSTLYGSDAGMLLPCLTCSLTQACPAGVRHFVQLQPAREGGRRPLDAPLTTGQHLSGAVRCCCQGGLHLGLVLRLLESGCLLSCLALLPHALLLRLARELLQAVQQVQRAIMWTYVWVPDLPEDVWKCSAGSMSTAVRARLSCSYK